MAFLVPKKWKSSWRKSLSGQQENSTTTTSSLDETDFLNIVETDIPDEKNTYTIEKPIETSPSKPQTTNINSTTTLPKKTLKQFQECPICGTVLMSEDTLVTMAHVDECLSNAVAKSDPRNKPRIKKTPPMQPNNNDLTSPSKVTFQPSLQLQQHHQYQQYPDNPYEHAEVKRQLLSLPSPQKSIPHPIPPTSDSPFAVICPYTECGLKMEAVDFYHHALISHTNGNQLYSCPICVLANGFTYQPKKGTNLYLHLKRHHSEFAQITPSFLQLQPEQKPVTSSSNKDVDTGGLFKFPSKVGRNYRVDTIQEDDEKECTICFEEFQKGDYIARLDCFCTFHKHCLEQWFRKTRVCPLHKD